MGPCAYYETFQEPKIIYQEIQYHPGYALDTEGRYLNNKGFLIQSADALLLAALNSPLLWWFGFRHFARMKDEALTPQAFRMETLPLPRTTAPLLEEAATQTESLAAITREAQQARRNLRLWYAAEWGLEKPSNRLADPFDLSAADFTTALRAGLPAKSRSLSSSAVARLHAEHAASIAPIAARLATAAVQERALSKLVNDAFGLTPEEVALMWATAPPRMPIAPEPSPKTPTGDSAVAA